MTKLDSRGWEIPDQTPVAIPAHIKPRDQRDSIREMIRYEISKEAMNAGYETFEEADDFDVGEDYDPTSPYEEQFDPETGYSLWDYEPPASADGRNALPDAETTPSAPPGTDGPKVSASGAPLGANGD